MVLAEAPTQWSEVGGDGAMHPVHDPARIPPTHLSIEEVRLLQKEVLRLRQKNRQRKQALRDLNAAMERKAYRLTLNNIERGALLDEYEDTLGKLRQFRKRKALEPLLPIRTPRQGAKGYPLDSLVGSGGI